MVRKGIAVVAALIVAVSGLHYYWQNNQANRTFRVAFLNVGQGDATLIRFETGEKMLVDCGPDQTVLSQLGVQLPMYDRVIDYLVVTHFDLDHYGGCIDVLKRYTVHHILVNGDTKPNDPTWQVWARAAQDEQSTVVVVTASSTLHFGGATLNFLWPDAAVKLEKKNDVSNNHALVFQLQTSSTSYLFTGDIEEPVERALLHKYCFSFVSSTASCPALRADVLKVPHHGSDTSSSRPFIRAVHPSIAVMSLSKHNTFGHPSPRVLKRYEREAITILRTDQLGAILFP